MNTTFFIIIVFLSSLGLLYFFNLTQDIFFYDSEDFKEYYDFKIVPLYEHIENVEYLVRKHELRNKNKKDSSKTELIFLDINANTETKTILKKMQERYNFKICTKKEIYAIIENKLKNLNFWSIFSIRNWLFIILNISIARKFFLTFPASDWL